MKIAFKDSVRLNPYVHFERPVLEILLALVETAPPMIGDTVLIISANDGRHSSAASLHYRDRAFDVRCFGDRTAGIRFSPGLEARAVELQQRQFSRLWVERLKTRLGKNFDVVLEADHIHLEHDPK